jgi:hypothetical protein
MSSKNKKRLLKVLIPCASFLVALSLLLHIAYKPAPLSIIISYSCDSVSISLADSTVPLPNAYIERDGIPGAIAYCEGLVIVAFVNPESYWSAKNTPVIWGEPNEDGVVIGVTPTYVTAGSYAYLPYELVGNREHVPASGGKTVVLDNRDNAFFSQNSRKINLIC